MHYVEETENMALPVKASATQNTVNRTAYAASNIVVVLLKKRKTLKGPTE